MRKLSLILAAVIAAGIAVTLTGCGGGSSGGKDLYDADSWDYDGDGKLNNKELGDYADFYQDAYDYVY